MPRILSRRRLVLAACAVAIVSSVPATHLGARRRAPVTVIACGDTRFTDPSNVTATNPGARRALVAQIAGEHPDAILVSGDLPWLGGVTSDYDEFRKETAAWRDEHLRILPALGNHEFAQCSPDVCL